MVLNAGVVLNAVTESSNLPPSPAFPKAAPGADPGRRLESEVSTEHASSKVRRRMRQSEVCHQSCCRRGTQAGDQEQPSRLEQQELEEMGGRSDENGNAMGSAQTMPQGVMPHPARRQEQGGVRGQPAPLPQTTDDRTLNHSP